MVLTQELTLTSMRIYLWKLLDLTAQLLLRRYRSVVIVSLALSYDDHCML